MNMLNKAEADRFMNIKGEVRGVGPIIDWDFIVKKRGKKSSKIIEEKMAELGYPLKYKDIKKVAFYPIGVECLIFSIAKEYLDFTDEEFEKLGSEAVSEDIFIKVFMGFFSSLKMISKQIPKIWRRHYLVGDLEMPGFSRKEGFAILKLRNFKTHPTYCIMHKGFFKKVGEMIIKKKITIKETKCMFSGDEYHEYLLKW